VKGSIESGSKQLRAPKCQIKAAVSGSRAYPLGHRRRTINVQTQPSEVSFPG